jgi:ferredoxin
MITVIDERCPQDHRCPMIRACPQHAISQEGHKAPIVNSSLCVECMVCVKGCPHGAFALK